MATDDAMGLVLTTGEQAALARIFALLAEDLGEREVREGVGNALLDLLRADHFASYVWDAAAQRFGQGVQLHMDPANLARYEAWYQYRDPITFRLQERRHPTVVSAVMPHRELERTEFFVDFLARDGLHWGINLHAFEGAHALGDLRVWRGRHRREFEPHDVGLLGLVEPAFIAALRRAARDSAARHAQEGARAAAATLSARERDVARLVARGATDKEIARSLGISPTTVRTYLRRLGDKSGAQRRAGIAALAAFVSAPAPAEDPAAPRPPSRWR